VTVTTPPCPAEIEENRDLQQRVADLEALIEEARRRARRRRQGYGAAAVLVIAAGVAAFIGFGGRNGGDAGRAALAHDPGSESPAANAVSTAPLGALPGVTYFVSGFAFDRRRPDTVYVAATGATGHVYKTTDGGANWRPTATKGAGWGRVDALTSDPRRPGTLYAGTDVAVYKTVDGGRSWRPWNRGLFPAPGEASPSPGSPKYHFGTPGSPSWNRGEGWVTAVAVDPANSSIVYAGAGGLRKSTDSGHAWHLVLQPRSANHFAVSAIASAPTSPEAVYAIGSDVNGRTSVYRSTDAGKNWRLTGGRGAVFVNGAGWGNALAVDPRRPTTIYAAIGSTLVRSKDAGGSWDPIMRGLPGEVIATLATDPQRPGTLYAGLHGRGIYKTSDEGRTWHPVLAGYAIGALAIDPAQPATIYAAGNATTRKQTFRILRSTDGGQTWASAP
jgi:photosystem II stability/assembly factor-like uncharacterized protein